MDIKIHKVSKWWLCYYIFWVCITSIATCDLIYRYELGIFEYLGFITLPITLLCFVFYYCQKSIFQKSYWQFYFYFSVCFLFIYPFITQIDFKGDLPLNYFLMGQVISYLLFTPQYIVLYLYAFKSNNIWKNA